MLRRLGALVVAVAMVGCGDNDSSADAGDASAQDSLPQCGWDESLDQAGPSAESCAAARTLLSCVLSDGNFEDCLSDNFFQCPDPLAAPSATVVSCENQCHTSEYVVACGGPPPLDLDGGYPQPPSPPTACRYLWPVPSGAAFYCCPCQ